MKKFFQFMIMAMAIAWPQFNPFLPTRGFAAGRPANERHSRAFKRELYEFLLAYRGPTGNCTERKPYKGACLSQHMINEIMIQLKDPNGDGNFTDSYFYIANPEARRNMLWNSYNPADPTNVSFKYPNSRYPDIRPHPFVMRKRVMLFEEQTTYTIIPMGVTSDTNYDLWTAFKNEFWIQQADRFPGSGFVPDIAGDDQLRVLAFSKTRQADGSIYYVLQGKPRLTKRAIHQIYQTRRMSSFAYNENESGWTPEEITELEKAIVLQTQTDEWMRKHPFISSLGKGSPDRARANMQAIEAAILVAPLVVGKLGAGMMAMKAAVPVLGETVQIGRTGAVTFNAAQKAKTFQFSTKTTGKAAQQSIIDAIADGGNMAERYYRDPANAALRGGRTSQAIIETEVSNTLVIAGENAALAGSKLQRGYGGVSMDFETHLNENIFYGLRPKTGGRSTVLHEYLHRLRKILLQAAGKDIREPLTPNLAETAIDYNTFRAATANGIKEMGNTRIDLGGYPSRKFLSLLGKSLPDSSVARWNSHPEGGFFMARPTSAEEGLRFIDKVIAQTTDYRILDEYLGRAGNASLNIPGFAQRLDKGFFYFDGQVSIVSWDRRLLQSAKAAGDTQKIAEAKALLAADNAKLSQIQKDITRFIKDPSFEMPFYW